MGFFSRWRHNGRLSLVLVINFLHRSLDTLRNLFLLLCYPTISLHPHHFFPSCFSNSFPPFSNTHSSFYSYSCDNDCTSHTYLLYPSSLSICAWLFSYGISTQFDPCNRSLLHNHFMHRRITPANRLLQSYLYSRLSLHDCRRNIYESSHYQYVQ